ncbi:MAG TPA: sialidase family protein [Thermomicrobiales bacterium]|nr:sialidase family protein [Thermomicrobiales bacterium]
MRLSVARIWPVLSIVALLLLGATPLATARDRPVSTSNLISVKFMPPAERFDTAGNLTGTGGEGFSKTQIERFRCESGGDPAAAVDMSCNTTEWGQDYAPDNEIAIAVNPSDPDHLVAGSNDYYYRFNNATGARQAIVPTGFFTSFDGGATWIDGQIPMQSGNGAGDPSPAFDGKHDVVLMAQLENTGGQGAGNVTQGDISVSRSTDGGVTWSEPVTVMKGQGNAFGQANQARFYDKEWLTVDNYPDSPFYGRAYVTSTLFRSGLHGSYMESPIFLSYSDDGGLTWSTPEEISGSSPHCTYQETGLANECDEDQFSIPEVAPDGTLYVHFLNAQNEEAWEAPFDFDSQIMVVRSTNGGETFGPPVPAVQLEDGLSDMPYSVIGRQTIWGHQIRWASAGNISVNPNNPNDITIVWSDRGTPNPNAEEGCFYGLPGEAPDYDPCDAGPGSDTDVYYTRSIDGGFTWSARAVLEDDPGSAWFPWSDHKPDGTLVVAWDQDTAAAPADTFQHVLKVGGAASTPLGGLENPDVSVTHWAGQYVPESAWPAICGPAGYSDGPVADAAGKDCNVFHGDYTGLAIGSDGSINVVWTGLNAWATSPQLDPYTGTLHDGYRQDAMFARR